MDRIFFFVLYACLSTTLFAASNDRFEMLIKYKKHQIQELKASQSMEGQLKVIDIKKTTDDEGLVTVDAEQFLKNMTNKALLSGHNKSRTQNIISYQVAAQFMKEYTNVLYAIPSTAESYPLNRKDSDESFDILSFAYTQAQSFYLQWGLHNTEIGIGAKEAFDIIASKPKYPVDVAVLDFGISPAAPLDITRKIDSVGGSYYFKIGIDGAVNVSPGAVDRGMIPHGTHVAGIIAANGPNVMGVAGAIDAINVLPVKVIGDNGVGTDIASTSAILSALQWAAGKDMPHLGISKNTHPIKVVNLSVGLSAIDSRTHKPWIDEKTWEESFIKTLCPAWKDAIDYAYSKGITVVFAAGNDAHSYFYSIPGACQNIDKAIMVEATSPIGSVAQYSNRHDIPTRLGRLWHTDWIVVKAPGGDERYPIFPGVLKSGQIYSTVAGGYNYMEGTSMSAPFVSGILAMLYAQDKAMSPKKAIDILKRSALNRQYGIVSAYEAVKILML